MTYEVGSKLSQVSINKIFQNGIYWNFIGQLFTLFLEFFFGIILARILTPSDYGIYAIVSGFIMFSNIIINSGLSQSLIRQKDISNVDYTTVFYTNILLSVILFAVLYFSSSFISLYFQIVELSKILKYVGFLIFIQSLIIIHRVILTRGMFFKIINMIDVTSSFISGIIAIFLATNGYGIWSLIIKAIISGVFTFFSSLYFTKWAPRNLFSTHSLKIHWNFGYKLLLSGLIGWGYKDLFAIILGRIFSIDFLGYYHRAEMLRNSVTNNIVSIFTSTSYPIMASVQKDKYEVYAVFENTLKLTYAIISLFLSILFIFSDYVIIILFGYKWIHCATILKFLVVSGYTIPLASLIGSTLNVYGRSDLYLSLQTIFIFSTLSALLILNIFGEYIFLFYMIFISFLNISVSIYLFSFFIGYPYERIFINIRQKVYFFLTVIIILETIKFYIGTFNYHFKIFILSAIYTLTLFIYVLISQDADFIKLYRIFNKQIYNIKKAFYG